jgi:hypothetical protein
MSHHHGDSSPLILKIAFFKNIERASKHSFKNMPIELSSQCALKRVGHES